MVRKRSSNHLPDQASAGSVDGTEYEPTLLRVLIIERHWQKFTTFERQFRRAALELAETTDDPDLKKVNVSLRSFERWYSGKVKTEPYPDTCRILEHMFGVPIRQLLSPPSAVSKIADPSSLVTRLHQHTKSTQSRNSTLDSDDLNSVSEWPVWFGTRIAHLITSIDNWRGFPSQLSPLQEILHQEILMFDAEAPDTQSPAHTFYRFSRRQALVSLAALPLTLTTSGINSVGNGRDSVDAATEFYLSRCAASLTACWHLLRGSDLAALDQILSNYLLGLQRIARQESKYQQAAAQLASQGHRICGIIALHRNKISARERHCKQALHYSEISADPSSKVSALVSLASTYFYNFDPARAASVYEHAFRLESKMSPLQRARLYAELSVVYGQLGREQDAIRSAGRAEELYPDNPEQDSAFLYAEFTPASLILEQGLAYTALAETYPDRGYQQNAQIIFSRTEKTTDPPDRIRYEIINHQARAAVLLNDLEAFEMHVVHGMDGIVLLGSEQRRKEMNAALKLADKRWPHERRFRELTERLQLTAGDGIEEPH